MPTSRGKDLSSLYPTPKSYDELEVEQKLREIKRRPRFVPGKIGLWTTLVAIIVLLTYQSITYLMTDSVASTETSIFGVSASILLSLIALALLMYLNSLITSLVAKVVASTTTLYVGLTFIFTITSLTLVVSEQHQYSNILIVAAMLLFNFLATYFIVSSAIKRHVSDHI